jgi:endonuclease/exonuclease/phosphatase family metal-dependent hydrolase
MRVKLINLNAWHGGRRLWDNIVQYLKEEQPDIITIQEAYASEEQNTLPYLRTVSALQEILGFPYSAYGLEFIIETENEKGPMGNAFLSKYPLAQKPAVWLQGTAPAQVRDFDYDSIPHFPRNILHCEAAINGQTYNLMTLHGVWAPDNNETDLQKKMGQTISKYIKGMPKVILSGDFNVNENTETVKILEDDLINIFKGERASSFNMRQKTKPGYATAVVDFIFASPDIQVLEHRTSDADVSDHQSQVVVMDL